MVSRPLGILTYSVWMSAEGRSDGKTESDSTRATVFRFMLVSLLGVHANERAVARRHRGAAREGVLRRALDGGRDLSLDRLEAGRRHAVRLQVLLVQPDRVALPPLLKQLGGKRLTRLALVVRLVPAHAEGLGDEQRGALAAAAAVGGELRSEERRAGEECRSRWSPH